MSEFRHQHSPLRRTLRVVGIYLLVSLVWIGLSDALVALWFSDPDLLTRVQTWKGVLFVLVTTTLLFVLIHRQLTHDRRQLELQLHQRREIHQLSQFRESVIDNAQVWLSVVDPGLRVTLWNAAAEAISGYLREEVVGTDEIWGRLFPDPEYRDLMRLRASQSFAGLDELAGEETTIVTAAGRQRLISWRSRRLLDEDGAALAVIYIGFDITDSRRAEDALKVRERQLTALMDNLPGMAYQCLYDSNWTMKFVSSGCLELTGYTQEELQDNRQVSFASLIDHEENEKITHAVEVAIGSAEPFAIEYRITRKDGRRAWVWERGHAVSHGDSVILEGIMIDITEHKTLEQELARMATRDPLTGLVNRRELGRLLDEEVGRAARYERELAVLWIDLDHFKDVNDTWGHAAGDRVLQAIAHLLAASIRRVDSIGRVGGEEFVAVLPEQTVAEAEETAERLRATVHGHTVELAGDRRISLSISVGIALYPRHGRTASELCNAADRAMYLAKKNGRNQVALAAE